MPWLLQILPDSPPASARTDTSGQGGEVSTSGHRWKDPMDAGESDRRARKGEF